MTDLIHGPAATAEAMRASEILFGGGLEGIASRFAVSGLTELTDVEAAQP